MSGVAVALRTSDVGVCVSHFDVIKETVSLPPATRALTSCGQSLIANDHDRSAPYDAAEQAGGGHNVILSDLVSVPGKYH